MSWQHDKSGGDFCSNLHEIELPEILVKQLNLSLKKNAVFHLTSVRYPLPTLQTLI